MALEKTKELNNGVQANYWVAEPRSDAHRKQTKVLMLLYLNKDARIAGHSSLFRVDIGTMNQYLPTGEELYAFVKQSKKVNDYETNWFADAEDC